MQQEQAPVQKKRTFVCAITAVQYNPCFDMEGERLSVDEGLTHAEEKSVDRVWVYFGGQAGRPWLRTTPVQWQGNICGGDIKKPVLFQSRNKGMMYENAQQQSLFSQHSRLASYGRRVSLKGMAGFCFFFLSFRFNTFNKT